MSSLFDGGEGRVIDAGAGAHIDEVSGGGEQEGGDECAR